MAGYGLNGPLCRMTAPDIDSGTTVRARSATPGILCRSRGAAAKKASDAGAGRPSASALIVRKACADAICLLTVRMGDIDAWSATTRQRFIGWFGRDDAAARAVIRKRIVKAINKLKLLHDSDFVNDPTNPDYAFVRPGESEHGKYERTVHLGQAFWATDDKTRAGTLIHETSHFSSVAGTDDVGSEPQDEDAVDFPGKNRTKYGDSQAAYGGARAARLAISNPRLALKNADSFEFFIEGRDAAVIKDERGNLDTEGFGDFPNMDGSLI
jgi:peptidyl-Lys metalloendopeptidase